MSTTRIFFIAGEASSDMHAAAVITALRARHPAIECVGYGGTRMRDAGMVLHKNLVDMAGIGLDFLTTLPTFIAIFTSICRAFDTQPPTAVVLVDYPGLNLRVAKAAKARGIPVIYYISPQVWAWGGQRVELIRNVVDHMLVVFAFEEAWYRARGVQATCVGHPLLDHAVSTCTREELHQRLGLNPSRHTVALLPGSRCGEVRRHLPMMLNIARTLRQQLADVQYLLPQSPTIDDRLLNAARYAEDLSITIVQGQMRTCVGASQAAIVASGTATLETALMRCPMLIMYKTSPLTYAYGKRVITLPYIGLVNIVAGKQVVPEFVQGAAQPAIMSDALHALLTNTQARTAQLAAFDEVRAILGEPGAAVRTAEAILSYIARE